MRICVSVFPISALVVCALLAVAGPEAARSQDKQPGDRMITVFAITDLNAGTVTVTLYRDGKAIATQDIARDGSSSHKFAKLRRGDYEVHFEAQQHTTVIKKVALQEEDTTLQARLPKGTGSVVLGGGPSLQELEVRIKKLEEFIGKLKGK